MAKLLAAYLALPKERAMVLRMAGQKDLTKDSMMALLKAE
jgi:hypothetical protein